MSHYLFDETSPCRDCQTAISPGERIWDGYGHPLHAACMQKRVADAQASPEGRAEVLVMEGWEGTSNKHRTIARMPEGLTGLETLKQFEPEAYRIIMEYAERNASSLYRRVYAREKDKLTLSVEEWVAFKKAGGRQSW